MEAIQDSISFFIHSHSYILIYSSIETCELSLSPFSFLFFFFSFPYDHDHDHDYLLLQHPRTEFKQASVQSFFSSLSSFAAKSLSHPQRSKFLFSCLFHFLLLPVASEFLFLFLYCGKRCEYR